MVVGQRKNVRIDVWIVIAKQIAAIELAIDLTEDKKNEKVCLVISNENNYVRRELVRVETRICNFMIPFLESFSKGFWSW